MVHPVDAYLPLIIPSYHYFIDTPVRFFYIPLHKCRSDQIEILLSIVSIYGKAVLS